MSEEKSKDLRLGDKKKSEYDEIPNYSEHKPDNGDILNH